MTQEEIKKLLSDLYRRYPNTKIANPQEEVATYTAVLGEYDSESVIKAAMLCVSELASFPKPSQIKKRIYKANLMYGNSPAQAPVKQITASKDSYIEEQIDYLMREFCEGGSLGYD